MWDQHPPQFIFVMWINLNTHKSFDYKYFWICTLHLQDDSYLTMKNIILLKIIWKMNITNKPSFSSSTMLYDRLRFASRSFISCSRSVSMSGWFDGRSVNKINALKWRKLKLRVKELLIIVCSNRFFCHAFRSLHFCFQPLILRKQC